MKLKINKFLAVLVCVAIMISVFAPVIAMTYSDDDCCEHHHEDGHVHDSGNSASTSSGSSEQGGGSTDDTPKVDNTNCVDCGKNPCSCDDYVCAEGCEHNEVKSNTGSSNNDEIKNDPVVDDCDCEECECENCEGDCCPKGLVESLSAGILSIARTSAAFAGFAPMSASNEVEVFKPVFGQIVDNNKFLQTSGGANLGLQNQSSDSATMAIINSSTVI